MSYGISVGSIFKALADDTRRGIIDALKDEPMAVHDLAARFDISRPAISKHLRVLGDAGLVRSDRVGKENLYRIEPEPLRAVADWIARYWSTRLHALKDLAERKH